MPPSIPPGRASPSTPRARAPRSAPTRSRHPAGPAGRPPRSVRRRRGPGRGKRRTTRRRRSRRLPAPPSGRFPRRRRSPRRRELRSRPRRPRFEGDLTARAPAPASACPSCPAVSRLSTVTTGRTRCSATTASTSVIAEPATVDGEHDPVHVSGGGRGEEDGPPARSAGSPHRPAGIRSRIAGDRSGSSRSGRVLSVATYPGAIAFTFTPWGAHSFASARTSPATPDFDAVYETTRPRPGSSTWTR